MKILIINGPNINLTGMREKGIYGSETYSDICEYLCDYSKSKDVVADIVQSNHEGEIIDKIHFVNILNSFLATLPRQKRIIFMRRYWYLSSIKEICLDFRMSESKVKMILLRLRNDFRMFLEKEGVSL